MVLKMQYTVLYMHCFSKVSHFVGKNIGEMTFGAFRYILKVSNIYILFIYL